MGRRKFFRRPKFKTRGFKRSKGAGSASSKQKKLIIFLIWVIIAQVFVITYFAKSHKRAVRFSTVKATVSSQNKKVISASNQLASVKQITIEPVIPPTVIPEVRPPAVIIPGIKKNKVAIVLDDWGYNLHNADYINQIKEPFTIAILPHHSYSRLVATIAHNNEKEVIIHLPMEPKGEDEPLEENTIMVNMPEARVKAILSFALEDVPFAKGINNHMGSKATENKQLMEVVFKQLKEKGLFFLDSWTGKSICKVLARKDGIRFAKRDVFLDNEDDPEYIKSQFRQLIKQAKLNGSAIGIGHDRPNTLLVFKEIIPEIKKNNIELVFVSEIVADFGE